MAQAVELKKGEATTEGFIGFSWTTLLFNFFVPLFRKDWSGAGIMFGVSYVIAFVVNIIADSDIYLLIPLAVSVFWACIYNKMYTKKLLKNSWEPANDLARTTLKAAGLLSA